MEMTTGAKYMVRKMPMPLMAWFTSSASTKASRNSMGVTSRAYRAVNHREFRKVWSLKAFR